MTKVSVIVPVYNTEKYLKQCLDSLISQTLKEIQIVIINDGSTDSSANIIQQYHDKYPEKIVAVTKENGGQGTARNLGLQYCTGEYIGFMDSDDYARSDMYEKLYNVAKRDNADYAACAYTEFYTENEHTKIISEYKAAPPCKETKKLFFDAEVAPWLHLYKREKVIDNGVRFPEGVIHEDTAFYTNLIPYIKTLAQVEEPLVMHRKHKGSTVGTMTYEKAAQIFPVIDDINGWYESNGFNEEYGEEKDYFCVRILLCSSVERIARVKGKANRKKLIAETMEYIKRNYPEYRKNKYLKNGLKNLYIKTATRFSVKLMCRYCRMKGKRRQLYL